MWNTMTKQLLCLQNDTVRHHAAHIAGSNIALHWTHDDSCGKLICVRSNFDRCARCASVGSTTLPLKSINVVGNAIMATSLTMFPVCSKHTCVTYMLCHQHQVWPQYAAGSCCRCQHLPQVIFPSGSEDRLLYQCHLAGTSDKLRGRYVIS